MSNLCQKNVKVMSKFFDILLTIQPRLTFQSYTAEGSVPTKFLVNDNCRKENVAFT